jgi:transcriptional regulator with XRE-family HTH domain
MARRLSNHPVDIHAGAVVRHRRVSLGISQIELAAKIGVSYQQVQKYERGANRMSASTLYEIAKALSMPIAEFFAGLPVTGRQSGRRSRDVMRFAATKEGSAIAEAFPGIGDKTRRRAIINLIRALNPT